MHVLLCSMRDFRMFPPVPLSHRRPLLKYLTLWGSHESRNMFLSCCLFKWRRSSLLTGHSSRLSCKQVRRSPVKLAPVQLESAGKVSYVMHVIFVRAVTSRSAPSARGETSQPHPTSLGFSSYAARGTPARHWFWNCYSNFCSPSIDFFA